jgi:1,4-dihydroxy-2-naphthoate octaprenyltransferase
MTARTIPLYTAVVSPRAWIASARPLAQANVAVPLVFGQALAYHATGRFDWLLALAIHAFGVVDQLFIVWANDVADVAGDAANDSPTPFSGGSRVLPDGKLSLRALARAAQVAAVLVVGIGAALAYRDSRPTPLVLALLAIALLHAYSFAPLRLSYRGEGEVLQGLGVGVVLPVFAFDVQAGGIDAFPWRVLVATFLLGWAGNVTTALPDARADAAVDKRTIAVRFGVRRAEISSVLAIAAAAVVAAAVGPPEEPPLRLAFSLATLALLAPNVRAMAHGPPELRRKASLIRFVIVNGGASTALLVCWSLALLLTTGT